MQEGALASLFPPPFSPSASDRRGFSRGPRQQQRCMRKPRVVGDGTSVLSQVRFAFFSSASNRARREPRSSGRHPSCLASLSRSRVFSPAVVCRPEDGVERPLVRGQGDRGGWSRKGCEASSLAEQGVGSSEPRRRGSQTRPSVQSPAGHGLAHISGSSLDKICDAHVPPHRWACHCDGCGVRLVGGRGVAIRSVQTLLKWLSLLVILSTSVDQCEVST